MTPTEKQTHHIKWLKFAILLSQTNFDELTEGQRLDLKNDFQQFLRSMPDPLYQPLFSNLRGIDAPPTMDAMMGEKDVDETRAKDILKAEFVNLASKINVWQIHANVSVTLGIARVGDTFAFASLPQKADERIFALLGYHLAGAGIPASWLRRCPQCTKTFLATQKPRSDRKLHCSRRCSSNVASTTHRIRKKLLPRANRLFNSGKSIEAIAKLTGLERNWLGKNLRKKKRARA